MTAGLTVGGGSAVTVRRDEGTIAYFDQHTPEYSVQRMAPAAGFIRRLAGPGASLIDLGCGSGNTLEYLRSATGVERVAGLDVSPRYVSLVEERLGCEAFLGSILDRELVEDIGPRFDFAVLAAVLHHLIGRTRSESRRYAELAIENARRLLRPGGYLIVHEPVYYPPSGMTALFYVKKGIARLASRRVTLFGYWNNVGAPVVSYYTNEALLEMAGPASLVEGDVREESVPRGMSRVIRKTSTTLALRR